jgi:hypothetical protein
MSDTSPLHQYAQAYRRLARQHANPELQTLLSRMADVWESLAAHSTRIAALRAHAESLRDEESSPDLSPSELEPIDPTEHTH